ncbi:MAG: hypothetical protein HC851_01170 [Acaryochloris sp. RU_4_1]|nr:hypothetical protein [Acaryochloris sp. SU_5_25]NJM64361.1 hypothetical protein [Acaryochloris sp. RU_4_1]NJN37639.1 hypothetical protein [Acaryochloridaceae cyanobacterium CSU_3_4]NJR55471.1 hypothetical protein [Acaryochloris sp. CRU_2_0]
MVLTHPNLTMPSHHSEALLTDSELIHTFVEGFVQGRPVLLSNANLRTEPLFGSMQLIDNKEGLISTANLAQAPISAKIRPISAYWGVLHNAMTAQSFYPLAKNEQSDCYVYRYCAPSENHEMHCTTAKELWRVCWGRGYSVRSGISLDLMVWGQGSASQRQKWHALRGMECVNGQLVIKILGGTLQVDSHDLVVWARQVSHSRLSASQQDNDRSRPRAGMRGYLPLRN